MVKNIIFLMFISFSSFSKTVIVSDIDDTIKISFVRSKAVLYYAFKEESVFRGMSFLYRNLLKETNGKIFYLSNAPKILLGYGHQKFLNINGFPFGKILLRAIDLDPEHKIKSLRKIVESEKPTQMILFGDNGEHDLEVYERLQKENPSLKIKSYIRSVYPVEEKDISHKVSRFVVPFEVVTDLYENKIISKGLLRKFIFKFGNKFLKERFSFSLKRFIPQWSNCYGHQAPTSLLSYNHELTDKIYDRIVTRCQ